MPLNYIILLLIVGTTMFLTVRLKKLTVPASIAGGVIGLLIFPCAGFTGIAMMATFFIFGTAATSWKAKNKAALAVAEENNGRRTAGQVVANAGVAGILGLLFYLLPQQTHTLQLMMAGSFSAATADTLSSELGNVYGSRFYNIISFKKDTRGLNGVVSVEGTLAGILGSIVIAVVYCIGYEWSADFFWIVTGGTIGNLADSILGATVERKRYLNNDAVNFINTSIGALTAMILADLF